MELALALERTGVHDLDSNWNGRCTVEGAGENGPEAALTEALRERVRGTAEGRVGEAMGWGVGVRGGGGGGVGPLASDNLAVEEDQEGDDAEGGDQAGLCRR